MPRPPHASPRDLTAPELAELDALIDAPEDDPLMAADPLTSAVSPVAGNSTTLAMNLADARAKARIVLSWIRSPPAGRGAARARAERRGFVQAAHRDERRSAVEAMTATVLALLGLWFLASVANQIPGPWARLLGPVAVFGVLPGVAFFAPEPVDVDYHLVIRDFFDDGRSGLWRELVPERTGRWRALWNVAKRDHQAMLTAVASLASLQRSVAPTAVAPDAIIQLSLPYLFLLHSSLRAPRAPGARERQFMILETRGFGAARKMELGILSNPHRLD